MATTFLYSLAGGMLSVLGTGRPDEIAWKFTRLVGLLVLGITCALIASTAMSWASAPTLTGMATIAGGICCLAALTLSLLAPFSARARPVFRAICAVGGAAGLAAGCLAMAGLLGESEKPVSRTAFALAMLAQAAGGIFVGSITIAWLLGHAYLTATRMTIAPLRHFSRVLTWSVVGRWVVFAACIAAALTLDETARAAFLGQTSLSWVVVALRVGAGLVAVGVFAYMVADCVRLRATQSATGILYFGSVFAYVGELAAQQLLASFGWPM